MSGHQKRRANNMRRRQLSRSWSNGWRPPIGSVQSFTSTGMYSKVERIEASGSCVTIEGIDQEGCRVREYIRNELVYATRFEEVLIFYRMKLGVLDVPRFDPEVRSRIEIICKDPELCGIDGYQCGCRKDTSVVFDELQDIGFF